MCARSNPLVSTLASLDRAGNTSVNHPHEGLICQGYDRGREYPRGYVLKEKKTIIGKGIDDFELASGIHVEKLSKYSTHVQHFSLFFISRMYVHRHCSKSPNA